VLEPLTGPAEAIEARWFYHREQGREAELLPDLERAYATHREWGVAMFIAQAHVRAGRDAEAAKVLAPHRTKGYVRLLYPLVRAADRPGRALQCGG